MGLVWTNLDRIAICFGLTVTAVVQTLGCQVNPLGLRIELRAREETRWDDKSKKESRRRQCCEDNGVRDEESPPYVKKKEPVTASSYSVIATQEVDGKEMVWLENPKQ